MPEISEDFIDSCWRGEPDPVAQLVTITSDADPTPIRVSDCSDRLLPARQQGIASNGEDYPYFPFQLAWAAATASSPFGEGRLTIANVDRRIEEACDAAIDPPTISLSLVRLADPDTVETAINGARIPAIDGDESKVSAVIRPRDFDLEPACARSYTPATTPGMF